MKYPITVTVYLDVIDGDLVRFNRYATIWHAPTGSSFGKSELPESITNFFCEQDNLSRKYLEEEFKVTEHTDDPKILVLKKTFGPDGRDAKPGVYCEDMGTHKIDLKYACFSKDPGYWEDYAPETYKALAALKPGQQLTVKSSPRKECRGMDVTVSRLYPSMWVATGACWESWDETFDLLSSFNLLSTDDDEARDLLKQATDADGEIDYEKANELAKKAGYNGITDFDAFNESIPYSHHTWEPGIDRDFSLKANSFKKLMKQIDDEEDRLMKDSQREWEYLEEMYKADSDE